MRTAFKQKIIEIPYLGALIRRLYPWIKAIIFHRKNRLQALELEMQRLQESLNNRQSQLKVDMARALAKKQDKPSDSALQAKQSEIWADDELSDFYAAFETAFRADSDTLQAHLARFIPYVEGLAHRRKQPLNILDIGCGRGEWLALMQERQHHATGIDTNQQTVDACRLEGLNVVQGDALNYLAGIESESLDLVSAFHVVEHLRFEALMRLFDACLRVLKPGGLIIFETPNPENLTVGAYSFYFDPTHLHPIPPLTLRFIAEQRGFTSCEVQRFNPRKEVESSALTQQWFEGPVDYALIGFK